MRLSQWFSNFVPRENPRCVNIGLTLALGDSSTLSVNTPDPTLSPKLQPKLRFDQSNATISFPPQIKSKLSGWIHLYQQFIECKCPCHHMKFSIHYQNFRQRTHISHAQNWKLNFPKKSIHMKNSQRKSYFNELNKGILFYFIDNLYHRVNNVLQLHSYNLKLNILIEIFFLPFFISFIKEADVNGESFRYDV